MDEDEDEDDDSLLSMAGALGCPRPRLAGTLLDAIAAAGRLRAALWPRPPLPRQVAPAGVSECAGVHSTNVSPQTAVLAATRKHSTGGGSAGWSAHAAWRACERAPWSSS